MNHKHSHSLLFTIAILITVFVYGLYGYMRYSLGVSLDSAIEAKNLAFAEEMGKLQQEELETIFADTKSDRSRLPSFFISDTATLSFIESIESLGERSGSKVALSGIEADSLESSAPGTLGRIKVRVDAAGSWQSVMRTLMLAESLPYMSSVNNVRLDGSGQSDGTSSAAWRASFNVEAVLMHAGNTTQP